MPKRKAQTSSENMDNPAKKTKAAHKKNKRSTDDVYTSQQKAAITQFMSFTSVDRNAAIRVLKSHNWDAQTAVNA
ncbi:hypothetical protein BKA63DRAFT_570902 [Paraphoma chrysanthemicola]|nr:hypothetical protein BKA63DRAFT_570902 [Paraphoma chrysanthemicola]